MKVHKHIEGSNVPTYKPTTWRYYLFLALLVFGMFGLLLIPSCMQAQSKEGTVISKGDQHDS